MSESNQPRVVIVGGGFGGLAAAINLKQHGFSNIQILEAASGIGGTWLHNTYPGAACDVPSHLYSYSFAQRRDWVRLCPTQPDILRYIQGVAEEQAVGKLVRTNSRVTNCTWLDDERHWHVALESGEQIEADAVVIATGQLHKPIWPKIEGIEAFKGHSFHSAQWDHSYNLAGKRVAVIGTGASAVQFVPEIVDRVGKLVVFQRTANWFMPRKNRSYPKPVALAIRWLPGVQAFRRRFIYWYGEALTLMIRHPKTLGRIGAIRSKQFMYSQVKDPEMRSKLIPDYTFGCKRVLFSSFFLPALQRPNVEVVTDGVERVTETSVVSADGVEHEVDCLIYGTGFDTNEFMFPMQVTGRGGLDLRDAWKDGPHAHLGISVPRFPSLFLMYGPNTNTSGGSIIVYLEAQANYIRQALEAVRARGSAAVEVRPEVELLSDRATQDRFTGTAWVGCDSWYRDDAGRVVANWPGYMHEYEAATENFAATEFEFIERDA